VVKNHELNWSKQFDQKQGVAKMARIFIYAKSDLAEALAMVLSMHGHSPICSENPREAFRQIVTFRPQLVLAEYLDIDGEWLCRQIRQLRQLQDTQVIMMSAKEKGLSEDNFRSAILAFGANDYLFKPFPCREIGNYVHSWLQAS
jgi:DNA-binding response OmpR family regulator